MSQHKPLEYRPDVDGLRAYAILAVVAFHYFPKFCSGGYIGVDVFFVISGFLITESIRLNSRTFVFSFSDFYSRRIKRLFPALALMLLCVMGWGWAYLVDFEFQRLGKHLLGGVFFVYNFVAERESGYFGGDSAYKLVHHIWSLAVEEQFYFVYPIYLIFAKRLKVPIALAIGFMIAVSFVLELTQINHTPDKVFYHPQYRVWELASGGLLTALPVCRPRVYVAFFAFVALVSGTFYLDESAVFPGFWAILPVVSTGVIIVNSSATRRFLGAGPCPYIGRISYPLYLWHWPLLVASNYFQYGRGGRGVALAASFLLAVFTYELVEKPIKKMRTILVVRFCVLSMAAIAVLAFLIYSGRWHTRNDVKTRYISDAMPDYNPPAPNRSFAGYPVNVIDGHGQLARQKVLFLGDSLAYQYYPRFEAHAPARQLFFLTGGGCPPIPGVHRSGYGHCAFIDHVQDFVRESKFDIIVVLARWHVYLNVDSDYHYGDVTEPRRSADLARASLEKMLKDFAATGAKVFVIGSTPTGERFDPRSSLTRDFTGIEVTPGTMSLTEVVASQGPAHTILHEVAEAVGIECLDPLPVFCSGGSCDSVGVNARPLYRDDKHLTPGVASEVRYLDFLVDDKNPRVPVELRCR